MPTMRTYTAPDGYTEHGITGWYQRLREAATEAVAQRRLAQPTGELPRPEIILDTAAGTSGYAGAAAADAKVVSDLHRAVACALRDDRNRQLDEVDPDDAVALRAGGAGYKVETRHVTGEVTLTPAEFARLAAAIAAGPFATLEVHLPTAIASRLLDHAGAAR